MGSPARTRHRVRTRPAVRRRTGRDQPTRRGRQRARAQAGGAGAAAHPPARRVGFLRTVSSLGGVSTTPARGVVARAGAPGVHTAVVGNSAAGIRDLAEAYALASCPSPGRGLTPRLLGDRHRLHLGELAEAVSGSSAPRPRAGGTDSRV